MHWSVRAGDGGEPHCSLPEFCRIYVSVVDVSKGIGQALRNARTATLLARSRGDDDGEEAVEAHGEVVGASSEPDPTARL